MKNTHQHYIQACITNLIGIPYDEKDCWDITKQFYLDILDIDLSSWDFHSDTRENDAKHMDSSKRDFIKVGLPKFGDILLIRVLGHNSHVGVYIGDGKFVHTLKRTGCVVDQIKNWKNKIEGYYRWPE